VRKYGTFVPGSAALPNAWVSVKLPIGVADSPSLGVGVSPFEPTWAGTADPTRCQPAAFLLQACRVAVVLLVEGATTVTTWVAEPVLARSGSSAVALRDGDGDGVGGPDVGRGVVGDDVEGVVLGAVVVDGGPGSVPGDELHAATAATRASEAITAGTSRRGATGTRSASHATPMRIRGWALGVSHFMSVTSFDCEIATQPAVALPFVTWKKNALPLGETGWGNRLASMTTA